MEAQRSRPQLDMNDIAAVADGVSGISIDDALGPDILHNILSRLPALCFASAACVNRTWNSICSTFLSVPKLTSALSLNPSLEDAVDEVVEKVLSSPTRPQFAIVYVGPSFNLSTAHRRISDSLGSRIPVVTSLSDGIIGRDALTNEFKEVQWEEVDDEDIGDPEDKPNSGILLTVGYLPGMKVNLIPLACQEDEVEGLLIDEFVTNIREYTSSITESASPDAIILFTDLRTDMRLVLQKMDYAFSSETIIVGDGGGRLLYRTNWAGRARRQEFMVPAVALLFVKDKNRRHGIRETKFMVALSTGLRPVGPTYKAASVKEKPSEQSTWLSARRAAVNENLDGQTILDNIYHELGHQVRFMALYIGVKKRRKCSVGPKKVRWLTFLEFHEVMGGDEEYLYVNNTGIRTGDSFQFYASDTDAAVSSCNVISETFKRLKQDDLSNQQTSHSIPDSSGLLVGSCNWKKAKYAFRAEKAKFWSKKPKSLVLRSIGPSPRRDANQESTGFLG